MWISIPLSGANIPWTGYEDVDGEWHRVEPPPILSLHWAAPWPHKGYADKQQETYGFIQGKPNGAKYNRRKKQWLDEDKQPLELEAIDPSDTYAMGLFTMEPNWAGAVRIRWQGADLRLFPHEYSPVPDERMVEYVRGDSPTHDLVPADTATTELISGMLDSDLKFCYEAALLDGCNHEQATAMLLGQDITREDSVIPANGWYRLKPEYAATLGIGKREDWIGFGAPALPTFGQHRSITINGKEVSEW